MLKKSKIFVLAALCFSFLVNVSCKNNSKESILLTEGWEFSLEEGGAYKKISFADFADLTKFIPDGTGVIFLQKKFSVPATLKNQDLSAFLGRITMADETYLNGILVGKTGRFGPQNEWSAWNTARVYHLPSSVLNSDSENILQIKIWGDGECSVTSAPFIAESSFAEESAKRQNFWNSQINLLFAAILLVIAAYHLLIFFQRTSDTENFMFAFINLVTAVYLSVFYIDELPGLPSKNMNFLAFQKIVSNALPFFITYLVTSFINEFFKRREKKWILAIRIAFVVIPVALLVFSKNYSELRHLRDITQIFLVPPLLYIMFMIVRDLLKKQKDIVPLVIGFSPLVVAVIADLFIHNIMHLYNVPYISMYGWMMVIIMFLFILAARFSAARAEAEDLNAHLEQKVKDRTKELSELNIQLEKINADAERDMKMATFVQQSFYMRKAPRVKEFDVAFYFKPMAGVSGDLYDFFTSENNLTGTALFDVSGHGISSGLVTMLSKSIITREFVNGMNEKLSDVMYNVNEKICKDKGDVENYLTGILLRFNGSTVDYVNAGHPPLLFRNAAGKVIQAAVAGSSASGSLVGMRYIPVEYKTMRFNMKKGDSLLLYTDCLQESRNLTGEEYSTERIMKAFEKSTGPSAQQKLETVLNDFNQYTKDVPLKDDLTMIVIVKK